MLLIIYKRGSGKLDKKIILFFIFFFLFLILFIALIFVSEYKNMQKLKLEYPNISKEAYAYRKTNLKIWAVNLIVSFLIPLLILTTGLSSKIKAFAENRTNNRFYIILIYLVLYILIDFILTLPIRYYSGFVIKHRFGLSNQSIGRWAEIVFKEFGLNLVLSLLFMWFPFYLIYKSPNRWWLYLGLISIPVYFFSSFVSPMYIDPLFNKYTALEDKELERDIKVLLEKAKVGDAKIYQVNKSADTKEMNAYMTGVLKSKRIVIWDTTIENLEREEVVAIAAHEIGHYVKGHIWKSIILGGISSTLLLFLVDKTSLWLLKGSNGYFGFRHLYDIACLPLLIFVLNFYMFFASPIVSTYSRQLEWQADKFELELARNKEATASSLIKLHEGSLALPRPSNMYKIWYYSHPSCEERVNFALSYEYENKLP
ncbi:MAG: Zn-dependent protease with chaperone function [Sporanaerobacter sp.]